MPVSDEVSGNVLMAVLVKVSVKVSGAVLIVVSVAVFCGNFSSIFSLRLCKISLAVLITFQW